MTTLLWLGSAGLALFVVTLLVDGATRPGYDPVRHPVSALALGPRGWVQTGNFLVCGVLVALAALAVPGTSGSGWLAVPIAVFGVSLLASGVFPMDAMRAYPPGTPDVTPERFSKRHRVHDWFGIAVFMSLPAAAVVATLVLDGAVWRSYSGLTGVAAAVLFAAFGQAWENDSPRAGLLQRVTMVVGWCWLALLLVHLAG
ncbi:DUF998 domain-containing protein [Georgenia halophila]|uniref:DUF998 domain-containing protein n=1 Tax=Georgenia halophila TaxID=620889 RepID=A0ABP8LM62_9MICO